MTQNITLTIVTQVCLLLAMITIVPAILITSRLKPTGEAQPETPPTRRERIITSLALPGCVLLVIYSVLDSINILQHPFPFSESYLILIIALGIIAAFFIIIRVVELGTGRNILTHNNGRRKE